MNPADPKRPLKEQLIGLIQTRFVVGRDVGERAFLVDRSGPNVALMSDKARRAIRGRFYSEVGVLPGRTPVDDAWDFAQFLADRLPKCELPIRVGSFGGASIVDLGDEQGRAVRIEPETWTLLSRSPITFMRTKATMAMAEPTRGGDAERIFEIVNVEPSQRRVFLAWLVAALLPGIAHPIATLRGEQGSAKSTSARAVVQILDPTAAPLLSPPKEDDRWNTSCSAHWILSFDNVSKVPDWWSDAMCRVVTGAGFETREYYTTNDVHVVSHRRCVILNGITLAGGLRPDLVERSIAFDLRRPVKRLTESEVDDRLNEIAPEVLGGLFDLAARAMAVDIARPSLPRMADFGLLLAKVDQALGPARSGERPALEAYREQLDGLFDESLAADDLASAVIGFMAGRDVWEGQTQDLLRELNQRRVAGSKAGVDGWPRNPTQLGHALVRCATSLRSAGVEMTRKKVGVIEGGRDQRRRGVVLRSVNLPAAGTVGTAESPSCVLAGDAGVHSETRSTESTVPATPSANVKHGRPLPIPEGAVLCPACQLRPLIGTDPIRCIDLACGFEATDATLGMKGGTQNGGPA